MTNFEDENGEDDAKALQEGCRTLERFQWDEVDVLFSFSQVEIKMKAVGAKKQFTKMQILSTVIPKKYQEGVKKILRKQESEFAENNAYKILKKEILRIFGPRPDAAIERALSRTLTGTPSELARLIVDDICKTQLEGCNCCPAVCLALWKRHLSSTVRAGIAHCEFSATTFNAVTQLADDIHSTSYPAGGPTVAAVSLDETQPAIPYATPEVAAMRRGGGNGRGRGGRGRGRGRGAATTPAAPAKPKGPRHPDLPADGQFCSMHHKWGRGSYFCADPSSCPWKNIFATRPSK